MFKSKLKKPVEKVNDLVNDRKTYIVILAALLIGVADGAGYIELPGWVIQIMPLLGLGTIRHAISKGKKAAEEAIEKANKKQ
jgi:hypothetical protein